MVDSKPRHYVIGILVFMLIITSGIFIIDSVQEDHIDFVEPDKYEEFKQAYDKREQSQNMVEGLKKQLQEKQDPSVLDIIGMFFLSGFQILVSLFTSLDFMNTVIQQGFAVFNFIIPYYLAGIITSIITAIIVFSIVSAILQRDI